MTVNEDIAGWFGSTRTRLNTLDLTLDPDVSVQAIGDPDTVFDGSSSEVTVTIENTGDVVFDGAEVAVLVDGQVICSPSSSDELPIGGSVELPSCTVTPDVGDAVTVEAIELPYRTWDDELTLEADEVTVDLSSVSTGLSVNARYGALNTTLPGDPFVARGQLAIEPPPFRVAGGPAVLQIVVENQGSVDLDEVFVTSDLSGCGQTISLAAGEERELLCDGAPVGADELNPTTSVQVDAQADGGPALSASDVASYVVIGVGLEMEVDPAWNGTGTDVPFLMTVRNLSDIELEGVAYAAFLSEPFFGPEIQTCLDFDTVGPIAAGSQKTLDACTLLAGDLVEGLSVVAYGSEDPFGEGATSTDTAELQFDPHGLVRGEAQLDGELLAGVQVDLRLIELLELPTTELQILGSPDTSSSTTGMQTAGTAGEQTAGGDGSCVPVDELTAADDGEVVASVTSDADSGFCFDQVPPGTYEIVVATVDDAELEDLTVAGTSGFTTNSPATSEPFFVGFASAQLGAPITASLSFVGPPTEAPTEPGEQPSEEPAEEPGEEPAVEPVADEDDADDAGPVDVDAADEDELPRTGVSTGNLLFLALLAMAFGLAIFGMSGRRKEELAPIRIDER